MLKVWDGPPENEMSLAELSGSLLPEGIHSTLNTVTVQFDTDFYISKSGFAIQFSSKCRPELSKRYENEKHFWYQFTFSLLIILSFTYDFHV